MCDRHEREEHQRRTYALMSGCEDDGGREVGGMMGIENETEGVNKCWDKKQTFLSLLS